MARRVNGVVIDDEPYEHKLDQPPKKRLGVFDYISIAVLGLVAVLCLGFALIAIFVLLVTSPVIGVLFILACVALAVLLGRRRNARS